LSYVGYALIVVAVLSIKAYRSANVFNATLLQSRKGRNAVPFKKKGATYSFAMILDLIKVPQGPMWPAQQKTVLRNRCTAL
jgi:hypothetical protein